MVTTYRFCDEIQLFVEKSGVPEEAALRQRRTAEEILHRLATQPGVILADEVGMGKTFVALAVAASVHLSDPELRPVVVMVPPSLKRKWPDDFSTFKTNCLPPELRGRLHAGSAENAESFLKFLDDPPERRKGLVFVTHGAMSRGLTDRWVKLALIRQALYKRHGADDLRRALAKVLGRLLFLQWIDRDHGLEIWEELLQADPSTWLKSLRRWGIDPEGDGDPGTDDDPVPRAVHETLRGLDTDWLYQQLQEIPLRHSDSFEERVKRARQHISAELAKLWHHILQRLQLRLPLLILDEAHHLKNEQTKLASLFRCGEALQDIEEVHKGPLAGVFERMLFLTATPFQLGHSELCSVLDRFGGSNWDPPTSPACTRSGFQGQIYELREALDAAQHAALRLDSTWGRLSQSDLLIDGRPLPTVEAWWESAGSAQTLTAAGEAAVRAYGDARIRLKEAEKHLKPWVIRHLKPRTLPDPHSATPRRRQLHGRAITDDQAVGDVTGLELSGDSVLPFLLAARAATCAPDDRPVFAEGLASSYDAFLHTRRAKSGEPAAGDIDADDDDAVVAPQAAADWYLGQLERLVPQGDVRASSSHPKVGATINRVLSAWATGEKVIVFCHFVITGKILRQLISRAIADHTRQRGAELLSCAPDDVDEELRKFGERFYDKDSPIFQASTEATVELLKDYQALASHEETIVSLVRGYLRTPSFLVRYFPLGEGRLTKESMLQALDARDGSGMTLRELLGGFFRFLAEECDETNRRRFLEAVSGIQTGARGGQDVTAGYTQDELQGELPERIVPNVRLVNGTTGTETRQRVMLAFNTPFYPEILIASSVMAEGVDLQRNCRYVIHHDLCWNPSMLEQRTGRIDRLRAKAERCGRSMHIYVPYIAETQDEKMFRVVMDRERWFSVVMGEKYKVDARTTEKLAQRLPLPESIAQALAFALEA